VSVDALSMCMPKGVYICFFIFLLFGVSVGSLSLCMPRNIYVYGQVGIWPALYGTLSFFFNFFACL
jgi:hypothetical protein